jgi:prepilin-type N-terminal cleavage/methylation domain-containing protein
MSRRGLTLLELLVVVTLLAVTAGMAVSAADTLDRRRRHEDSLRTLAAVRQAILGPAPADGIPAGGFLADMGWPPADGADLWDASRFPLNTDRDAANPRNVRRLYDATWQTYRGWAGPYLTLPAAAPDGTRALRDGWGRPLAGWTPSQWPAGARFWTSVLTSLPQPCSAHTLYPDLTIHSLGPSGDGTEPVPPEGAPLVDANEWTVDIGGWAISLTNSGRQTVTLNLADCRWMVTVPVWKTSSDDLPRVYLDHWPESRQEEAALGHIGAALSSPVVVPVGGTVVLYFGSQNADTRAHRVPVGRRMLFLVKPEPRIGDEDGSPLRATPNVLRDADGHVRPLGQAVWIWPGMSPPTIQFDVAGLSN